MRTTSSFVFLSVSLRVVFGCSLLSLPATATAATPTHEWTEQLGTSVHEESNAVSADGLGNVYISGFTRGDLGGPNAGLDDAFVSKYDAAGSLLWTEQLGTSSGDVSKSVSADGLGNVYISGHTLGSLGGPNASSSNDAWVSKYDDGGNLLWTEQLGTSSTDVSNGVSADGLGNVYISGYTGGSLGGPNAGLDDAFVSKYDAAGSLLWTEQLGTSSSDYSQSVSADGLGNVYISGFTRGDLGGPHAGGSYDAWVSKYDDGGNLLWTEQLGSSSNEESYGVSADGLGNVYISGGTWGDLSGTNAGGYDAWVSMYDDGGNLLWTEQLGTSGLDDSRGVSADGLGNVYISGRTYGSLGGSNAGSYDAFVSKYDAAGSLLWTEQLGTSSSEESQSVSADGLGNVYISGHTLGSLGYDAFVAKYSEIPEPTTSVLALIALCLVMGRRRV